MGSLWRARTLTSALDRHVVAVMSQAQSMQVKTTLHHRGLVSNVSTHTLAAWSVPFMAACGLDTCSEQAQASSALCDLLDSNRDGL